MKITKHSRKLTPTQKMIEEFYKEQDRSERDERFRLDMVRDSADVWRACLEKPFPTDPETMADFKNITMQCLQFYWGPDAWCEFDEQLKQVRCCHPDGRLVLV